MDAMDDPTYEAKAEIYDTLAVINRAFEQIISALHKLEVKVGLGDNYVHTQEIITSEV
jgi:hypothetical protein